MGHTALVGHDERFPVNRLQDGLPDTYVVPWRYTGIEEDRPMDRGQHFIRLEVGAALLEQLRLIGPEPEGAVVMQLPGPHRRQLRRDVRKAGSLYFIQVRQRFSV